MCHDDVRRHIETDARASLYKDELADVAFLVDYDARRENGTVVNLDIAGNADIVAEDATVGDLGVMPDVRVGADEAF